LVEVEAEAEAEVEANLQKQCGLMIRALSRNNQQ